MRSRLMMLLLLSAALLSGCSQTEPQETQSTPDSVSAENEPDPDPEAETVAETQPATEMTAQTIYYVTDHNTTDPGEVSSFLADLTESGYLVETDRLSAFPTEAQLIILNTPQEDFTAEELAQLDSYMDEGGHILLLMPASEQEIRFRNLELLLEEFCLIMDYDIVQETQTQYTYPEDADYIQMSEIGLADGMSVPDMQIPAFQRNVRSFSMMFADHYGGIRQDAMLRTNSTAVGLPCGGTEDDPETFEDMELTTMAFSRDERRANSAVAAVGSSDFLLDENYAAETSTRMKELVFSSVDWMVQYLGVYLG